MALDELKRWHWCVIGVVVGCAVAAMMIFNGHQEPRGSAHVSPTEFESHVLRGHDDLSRRSVAGIQQIVIHPSEALADRGHATETEFVSYVALMRHPDDPSLADAVPHYLIMQSQNAHDKSVLGKDVGKMPVREYLAGLNDYIAKLDKVRFPKVVPLVYRFRWIDTPKGAFTVYPAGGFVLIGLIWPTIVNLLVGAGFGRGRREDDDFKLSKYKGKGAEAGKKKATVSDADMDQLTRLEAELEAKLRASDDEDDSLPDARPATPATAPIPVLTASGPDHTAKEAPKDLGKPKGYGADQGDYYPTEVHGKPKD